MQQHKPWLYSMHLPGKLMSGSGSWNGWKTKLLTSFLHSLFGAFHSAAFMSHVMIISSSQQESFIMVCSWWAMSATNYSCLWNLILSLRKFSPTATYDYSNYKINQRWLSTELWQNLAWDICQWSSQSITRHRKFFLMHEGPTAHAYQPIKKTERFVAWLQHKPRSLLLLQSSCKSVWSCKHSCQENWNAHCKP